VTSRRTPLTESDDATDLHPVVIFDACPTG
jgi:hypothetical protein